MQRRKALPSLSPKHTLCDFHPPLRRRNLSLSDRPPPAPLPLPPTPPSFKAQASARNYSRKGKLFLRSEKIQKARDLTKRTQENVMEYIQLRGSVRSVPVEDPRTHVRTDGNPEPSPKLSIRLLNVPLNLSLASSPLPRDPSTRCLRMRTDPSSGKTDRVQFSLQRVVPPAAPQLLSPKKYNELTLREIVESEEEVPERLQLFQKIRSLKERLRERVGAAAVRGWEEPLQGW